MAEDQEYVDRILPLFDELPHLKNIVVIDYQGMFMYEHPALIPYEKLMQDGERYLESNPAAFEEAVAKVKPTDNVFIVYTSGTTGNPKGVLINHGKHIAGTYNIIDRFPILADRPHRTVIYLPLCHILGKDVAITLPLLSRIVPHYGEDIEDLGQTIFEIAPTILFTVPRYLQKFVSNIIVGIEDSSRIKRYIYQLSLKTGRLYIKKLWEGKENFFLKVLYRICYHISFRPILNKIGFAKLKLAVSGGAPLPIEVMGLWQIYGVSLAEMYGQTETAGAIIAGQDQHYPRPGNVGVPPSGWEVKFGENDEILVKANDIFEDFGVL